MIISERRTIGERDILESPTAITLTDQEGGPYPAYYSYPATPEEVELVLNADPNLQEGMTRSEWRWFRFADGDLMLGVFPQDQLYFHLEPDFK